MMMRQTKMRCYMSVIIGKRNRRNLGHFLYFFGRDGSHFPSAVAYCSTWSPSTITTHHDESQIPFSIGNGIVHEIRVLGHLRRLVNQRRVGRSILWFQTFHLFDVARVRDNDGVLLEFVQLSRHGVVVFVVIVIECCCVWLQ